MTHCHKLEAVGCTICHLCSSTFNLKGIPIFLIGKFCQILTVLQAESRSQIIKVCFKRSQIYLLFTSLQLHTNIRLLALQNDLHATAEALMFHLIFFVVEKESFNKTKEILQPSLIRFSCSASNIRW